MFKQKHKFDEHREQRNTQLTARHHSPFTQWNVDTFASLNEWKKVPFIVSQCDNKVFVSFSSCKPFPIANKDRLSITKNHSLRDYLLHKGLRQRPSWPHLTGCPTWPQIQACPYITTSDLVHPRREEADPPAHPCHCQSDLTFLQKRTPILRSWKDFRNCSSRRGLSSDTRKGTSASPWARCTATTSPKPPFPGSRPSICPSRTCASWSRCWPSGSKTRTSITARPPRPHITSPHRRVFLAMSLLAGRERNGHPSTPPCGWPSKGRSIPTQSPPPKRSPTSQTAFAWRKKLSGSGSATEDKRKKEWTLPRTTALQVLRHPARTWETSPLPRPHRRQAHQCHHLRRFPHHPWGHPDTCLDRRFRHVTAYLLLPCWLSITTIRSWQLQWQLLRPRQPPTSSFQPLTSVPNRAVIDQTGTLPSTIISSFKSNAVLLGTGRRVTKTQFNSQSFWWRQIVH